MSNPTRVKTRHHKPDDKRGARRFSLKPLASAACLAALMATMPSSALALAADSTMYSSPTAFSTASDGDLAALVAAIPQSRISSEPKARALQGLQLIGKGLLKEGSAQLNAALQLDPTNSYLQFFNAYAYHRMAHAGDSQKFGLAEQGYTLAVQFDRSNWIAHFYLAMLYFEQRNFHAAQSELAEVLLFREDDQEVLFRMVAASYYAGDPVTAAACLGRLRALQPRDPEILRLSAILSAAVGNADEAQKWLEEYRTTNPDAAELARAQERIKHWRAVLREKPLEQPANGMPLAKLTTPTFTRVAGKPAEKEDLDSMAATTEEVSKFPPPPSSKTYSAAASGSSGSTTGMATAQDWQVKDLRSNRMVLVDVVLMRTEDSLATHKGVNLLNALTLQFGTANSPGFSKTGSFVTTDGVQASTTTILRGITIPALTYSLNIANSNTNLNEVLARPTLAALDGVKSEFFSGTTLNAAVVSQGTNSSGAVQIEKEIGVKLTVLPMFLPDGKIKLTVEAQRTFIEPASNDVNFTYKIEVSKILVSANVVMDFGETLVLGGLSEKETSHVRDGVPLLQDVPVAQYLFSHKDDSDFQRSVLMLITPRKAQYTYRSEAAIAADPDSVGDMESMKELRARYGDWFKPYPNMASVFNHLNSSSLYREFRTGDVTLEKWNRQDSTSDRLKQALEFLFY